MRDLSRRKVLQSVGAASIGVAAGSGVAGGHFGHMQLPECDDCPPGTEVLVKYDDWDNETGEFEHEGCDAVEFTEVVTDEDGEPVAVTFTSSLYFQEVRVKTGSMVGDSCDSLSRAEVLEDPEPKDGEYTGSISNEMIGEEDAISYIAFCSAACFQVDFVFGDSIENLGEDDDGFFSSRKIQHLWGNTVSGRLSGTQGVIKTNDGCTVSTDGPISANLDSDTATVTFDLDGEDCTITLVSYVAPCPIGFTKATGDQQHRFWYDTQTFDAGTGHELTVQLPTPDDIGALCVEATENAV